MTASRRDLITGFLGRIREDLPPPQPLLVRPPGAIDEPDFLVVCTRCGDCEPVCPPGAIQLLSLEVPGAMGTPVVVPRDQACVMCTGTPCITACEAGALLREPNTPPLAIGLAEVDLARCWSAQGQDCDFCAKECRRHVGAISVRMGHAPRIDVDKCDGCGLCEHYCPTPGDAAIRVVPLGGGA